MSSRTQSEQLFAEALKYIPGGVNSPVRAFRAVGGQPFFVNRAKGARVWDVDGNEYVDYVGTWGPAILGHAHPKIIRAVQAAAEQGTSFGIPNPSEVTMARLICSWLPSVQKVRMCNSGTEATMSAIRLARGFTKRDKIIKFDGCYHGHADSLLVKAGSGALTFGNPDSAGVPAAFTQHTIVLPYNDTEAVKAAFAANPGQLAGIIIEPVPGNAGLYLPKPGYLEFLRQITQANGALLIFDEVMTGFRLAKGGAQERFGITPDLSCFGKVIGGGLPVGAFGGRAEIMDCLAPLGPVYQAGTLSGNPVAMAAGIAALEELAASNAYARLEQLGAALEAGLKDAAKSAGVPVQFNRCGSMFCGYFTSQPVHNLADAMHSDRERFKKYFHGLLDQGIYLAPSQFEAGFLSTAHSEADIDQTVRAAAKVMNNSDMRILALDHGTKRIGIAVSDELKMIAQPLEYVLAEPYEAFLARLQVLLREKEVELILIGMPRNMDGTYGPAALKVREFIVVLKETVTVPIKTWDERLTSSQANRLLIQGNVRRDKRKEKVDKTAAAILLQSYLDNLTA